MVGLVTNLLLAHFLADFPLQCSSWVANKREYRLAGRAIYLHTAVVLIVSWIAIGYWGYWWFAGLVAASHFLIDFAKVRWTRNGPRSFLADQALHVAFLVVVAYFFMKNHCWCQWELFPAGKELLYPAVITSLVFCIWPANYFIRETVKYCRVKDDVNRRGEALVSEEVKRSGALIGAVERVLVLIFILMGSFEAAGLTIAAKSLLRFNDSDGPRTEYVLAGTLMSLLAALTCVVAIYLFVLDVPIVKIP